MGPLRASRRINTELLLNTFKYTAVNIYLTVGIQASHGPVINVTLWTDVPTLNGVPHLVHHRVSPRLLHQPNLRPVEHDVREHAARVVRHLDPVRLADQQVTVAMGDTGGRYQFIKTHTFLFSKGACDAFPLFWALNTLTNIYQS